MDWQFHPVARLIAHDHNAEPQLHVLNIEIRVHITYKFAKKHLRAMAHRVRTMRGDTAQGLHTHSSTPFVI